MINLLPVSELQKVLRIWGNFLIGSSVFLGGPEEDELDDFWNLCEVENLVTLSI